MKWRKMMSKINFQDWFEELKEYIIKETEKRVIDEVINRFEKCRNMVDFNYALNEYIRDFGVSYE